MCGVPVLPAIYGESLSYMEVQGKMQYQINELIDNQEEFDEKLTQDEATLENHGERITQNENDIEQLEEDLDETNETLGRVTNRVTAVEDTANSVRNDFDTQIGNNYVRTSVPQYDVAFTDHEYDAETGTNDGCITFKKFAMNRPNNIGPSTDVEPATDKNVKVNGWDSMLASIPKNYPVSIPIEINEPRTSTTLCQFCFSNEADTLKLTS